jgi:hypothetical protein
MDVIYYILSCFGGALILYLTAYTKVKGKNQALKEDVQKLENEKQKIIAKYRAETEEIKKQHTLDVEKRKYKYEIKRAEFSKYFALLDEFHNKCNSVFLEQFKPIITEFYSGFLSDDPEIKHQSTIKYNDDVQSLIFELHEEHIKVKTEQNSIRLIASKEVDNLLDALETSVKLATDLSTNMLKFMTTDEFWADQSLVAPLQEQLTVAGNEVLNLHLKLREQMKLELNEI